MELAAGTIGDSVLMRRMDQPRNSWSSQPWDFPHSEGAFRRAWWMKGDTEPTVCKLRTKKILAQPGKRLAMGMEAIYRVDLASVAATALSMLMSWPVLYIATLCETAGITGLQGYGKSCTALAEYGTAGYGADVMATVEV